MKKSKDGALEKTRKSAHRGCIVLWDFFTIVLILFPLFTGGVWINRPGLFVELSDLAIPVIIMSVWFALIFYCNPQALEKSKVFQWGLLAWKKWVQAGEKAPRKVLTFGALFTGFLWSWASLRRHWALGSHKNDLGIYLNGLWNFVYGRGYWSSTNGSTFLMPDHQSPSFLLLAPFFRFFPNAEFLLIFQAIGLVMGGVALFYLGKQFSQDKPSSFVWALPLLYWAYLPNRFAYFSDFHPEVILVSSFLWAMVGLLSSSKWGKVAGGFLLLYSVGLKEAVLPVISALGVSLIFGSVPFSSKSLTRWVGISFIIVGAAGLSLDLYFVPWLYGSSHFHLGEYDHFGGGILRVILSPLLSPEIFLSHLLSGTRLQFLFWTLGPLAFLPLLNWRGLIVALPGYLLLFLSSAEYRITPIFHYGIIPAAGLFFALPQSLFQLEKRFGRKNATLWILFWALACHGRSDLFRIRSLSPSPHARWLTSSVLPNLNPSVSVSASDALVPHLANREYALTLPAFHDPDGQKMECLLWDPQLHNLDMSEREILHFDERVKDEGYTKTFTCEGFSTYELHPGTCFCSEMRCE